MKLYTPIQITDKMLRYCEILTPSIDADTAEPVLNKHFHGCFTSEKVKFRHSKGQDLTGKTLLVMRRGGYGDILWITRIVRKLHEQYKDLTIWVASNPRHHLIWAGNTDVKRTIPYPIPQSDFEAADYHLTFEECIEPDRTGRSVYEIFAERAGIALDRSEMIPIYKLPSYLSQAARKILKGFGIKASDKKVMIHMGASSPWKSWPPEYCFNLAIQLGSLGIKVLLSGNKNVFKFEMPPIKNVYQVCSKTLNGVRGDFCSMELSLALMARMDLLISQDTGLTHFAAALDVPCIAIYGPFPARAYVDTYPNVTAIEPDKSSCPKLPCFPHLDNVCRLIDRHGHSPCLKSVKPGIVIDMVLDRFGITERPEPINMRMEEA